MWKASNDFTKQLESRCHLIYTHTFRVQIVYELRVNTDGLIYVVSEHLRPKILCIQYDDCTFDTFLF